jgi:non-ribosomal peptide synthetase-like protein
MPLRRTVGSSDTSRTYNPPVRLKLARAAVELCRMVPVMLFGALAVLVVAALAAVWSELGPWAAVLAAGPVVFAATIVAALTASAAKWLLVGRFRVTDHALWTSFVWRNELADTFVEVLAAPWLFRFATGTPLLSLWLRTLGAKIGRGAWLETFWLPEYDLVRLGPGATVNRGCVVLPGASIGARTTVGPGSLVTRGDAVPGDSRWLGNPISAWA